jgi:hypothetical protein
MIDTTVYLSMSQRNPGEAAGSWISRARTAFFQKYDLVLLRKADSAWIPYSVHDLAVFCGDQRTDIPMKVFPPLKLDPNKVAPLLPRIAQARRQHKLSILQVDEHTLLTL